MRTVVKTISSMMSEAISRETEVSEGNEASSQAAPPLRQATRNLNQQLTKLERTLRKVSLRITFLSILCAQE